MASSPSNSHVRKVGFSVDGRTYTVQVLRRVAQPVQAPRLIVVAYQPNDLAQNILRVCIRAIQRYTPEAHELWIVDNNSPRANVDWLLQWPEINVVLNRTEPVPPEGRGFWVRWKQSQCQQNWGSYANAVALEIGARLIDPNTQFLMTMHMDVMPCREGWLSFLRGKMNERVRASGVRMDTARTPEGILHVLGYLVDFQLFKQLGLDFFPRLPQYDVGDHAIYSIRQAGYDIFACPNSLWDDKLIGTLPLDSPFRALHVDRSFDDAGNVIFLHLGHGVRKASGEVIKGTTTEEWIKFVDENLLS